MGTGCGIDGLDEAAAYPCIPCTSAGMASCDLHLQTPAYKWDLKAVERGWGKGSSSWEPSMSTAGFAKIFLQIDLGCFQDCVGPSSAADERRMRCADRTGGFPRSVVWPSRVPGRCRGHGDQQGAGVSRRQGQPCDTALALGRPPHGPGACSQPTALPGRLPCLQRECSQPAKPYDSLG